jgi:uncharacterized protein
MTDASSRIESPCVSVCEYDAVSNLCFGCGRTLAEIEAWTRYTSAERAAIMAELPARLRVLHNLPAIASEPS